MRELNLFFVGTTENLKEDYARLLDKLELPQTPLGHHNRTIRLGKGVSEENIKFLKDFYKDDYLCLQILQEKGYLTREYLDNILNKNDYVY